MQIDDQLISKLEKLSRLQLDEKEREVIKKDLNNILKMIDKLQELDTKDVEPLIYMNENPQDWRPDEVENELPVEQGLKNAPLKNKENYFLVPKMFDK